MSVLDHAQAAVGAAPCPCWCRGRHAGGTHTSLPLLLGAGGGTLSLGRDPHPGACPTSVLLGVEDGDATLVLSPAQARQLAFQLREYAELAEYGEQQWRRAQRSGRPQTPC